MKEFLERAANAEFSSRDLHIVLDAMPIALSWAALSDGTIQFTNRAFGVTFGYPDNAFSTIEDWVEGTFPNIEERARALRQWNDVAALQAVGISETSASEFSVRHADGKILTVQYRGIILHSLGFGIATFEDMTDRRSAEDALRRIAFEDPLTGLPNRRVLKDFWRQNIAVKETGLAAVLLLDLDGFKNINDRLGHDAGDQALIEVASRLRKSVSDGGIVSRIGGDEFAIVLPTLTSLDNVKQTCWRIMAELSLPLTIGSDTLHLGASIGASVYGRDALDLTTLLKSADEALYRIKKSGKGGWGWYRAPNAA